MLRLLIKRAFTETKVFWTTHRKLATFSGPLAALGLKLWIEGRNQVNLSNAFIYLIGGYAVAWTATFLWNLGHTPFALIREKDAEILKLHEKAKDLVRLRAADLMFKVLVQVNGALSSAAERPLKPDFSTADLPEAKARQVMVGTFRFRTLYEIYDLMLSDLSLPIRRDAVDPLPTHQVDWHRDKVARALTVHMEILREYKDQTQKYLYYEDPKLMF